LLSDSYLTAAGTAYLGPFPPGYRTNFFNTLKKKMNESGDIKVGYRGK